MCSYIWTEYRPVPLRLREWKQFFPNLQKEYEDSATINDDVFFRDYSVHQYLEVDLSKHRLEPQEYSDSYYSNECFQDVQIISKIPASINIMMRKAICRKPLLMHQPANGYRIPTSRKQLTNLLLL